MSINIRYYIILVLNRFFIYQFPSRIRDFPSRIRDFPNRIRDSLYTLHGSGMKQTKHVCVLVFLVNMLLILVNICQY